MERVNHTPLSPLSFLERSASVWPDKEAVVCGQSSWSYREFADEVATIAGALSASGVGPGDRVAYLMPNVPQLLAAHYAVPLLDAILVAVNTRLSADEIAYILEHSGAKVVVVDGALLDVVADALSRGEGAPGVTDVVLVDDEGAGVLGSPQARERVGDRLVDLAEFRERAADSDVEPTWGVHDEEQHLADHDVAGAGAREAHPDHEGDEDEQEDDGDHRAPSFGP